MEPSLDRADHGAMKVRVLPHTDRGRAVLVFLVLLAVFGYFFPRLNNWGANSRMDLIYALGDKGTVMIDDYHLNTQDRAYFEGHYYLEKSIGPSLAGLPFYMVFKGLVQLPPLEAMANADAGPGALPTLESIYREHRFPEPGTPGAGHPLIYHAMALTFVTFFSVAVLSALLGTVVYLMASRFAERPGDAVVLAFAFALGTPAFAFSNELFQHQTGAFGAFVGFFLLWRIVEEGAPKRGLWLVGVLFGYAAASEYVLAPILAVVVMWATIRLRPRRHVLRVVAGAVPWVVATATYNLLAFGTPLPIGYRYSVFGVPAWTLFGFVRPSWEAFYGITFSPYRGLFLLSPFLLLAPIGIYRMVRHDRTRRLAALVLLVSGALFAYNVCYWVWDGGGSVGPRHLVPMLPFLSLPVIFVLNAAKTVWARAGILLLIVVSIVAVWSQFLAGNNFPPDSVGNPLLDYALPLLGRGEVRFNMASVFGLRGLVTLVPLVFLLAVILVLVPWGERMWLRRRASGPTPAQT